MIAEDPSMEAKFCAAYGYGDNDNCGCAIVEEDADENHDDVVSVWMSFSGLTLLGSLGCSFVALGLSIRGLCRYHKRGRYLQDREDVEYGDLDSKASTPMRRT